MAAISWIWPSCGASGSARTGLASVASRINVVVVLFFFVVDVLYKIIHHHPSITLPLPMNPSGNIIHRDQHPGRGHDEDHGDGDTLASVGFRTHFSHGPHRRSRYRNWTSRHPGCAAYDKYSKLRTDA